ncbi:cysteine-rich receptor-like protein kinase 2 isoform X1 [Telopea speciosissima]|uniref:cysteine-rich receptor-like protein kinase 2 isoform X1 n=1 Tax=Telopea speciosissima TaxID=54955 RepID=UPI001CC7DB7C|nr:cysteine-rich receptor-like protein kinase 2 isoform X1 [Telopea speciosissima]
MGVSENRGVAFVVFLILSFLGISLADPRTSIAGLYCNTSYAASGAVLADYFVPAMDNLSSLVNRNGFGTTVFGEGPNAVFALAQCYEDLGSIDCKLCFSEIRSILPKCYPKTGGRIFLDGCFGRYENFSFFNEVRDSKDSEVCAYSKNSSLPDKFRQIVIEVVGNVSTEAIKSQNFAVGSVSSSNLSVYALAQCWENLESQKCNTCLQAAASSVISCSPAIEGRSLNAGCYLRYSTRMFWNSISTTSDSSGNHMTLWIIIGSTIGVLLLLSGIGIWKAKAYLRKSDSKSLNDVYGSGLSSAIAQSKLNFRYQELRKATKNFDLSNKLGQGSYGTVYKGVLPDGREVAVKKLFLNTRQWISQFLNEVDLVNCLRHKNLVKLLGCSADGPESLLVYEYYFNRSLDEFIFDPNRAKVLDWEKRLDIIQGVAEGLSYLHEESEIRIIHRDIKASNVLLDDKFKPKITDFGLARSFGEDLTHLSTGIAGTLGYMAPEYVVHGHLTEKADVYSFGVLILEIVSGQRCSSGVGSLAGNSFLARIWSHYKDNTLVQIIDRSFYEDGVKDEILHVVRVGLLCTQATPGYRPTMVKIVELLRSNRDQWDLSPTSPPFLDVSPMDSNEEGEGSHLLSMVSTSSLSGSSHSRIHGR